MQKTVLVTGASRGLGLEFVKQYADEGWQVIATCRNPQSANALQQASGVFYSHQCEILDW